MIEFLENLFVVTWGNDEKYYFSLAVDMMVRGSNAKAGTAAALTTLRATSAVMRDFMMCS